MATFKIGIQRGFLVAPALIVDATDEVQAIKVGRELSGLGRFKEWIFTAHPIKTKQAKTRKTDNND